MSNRWQEYVNKNGTTPIDLLNPKSIKSTEPLRKKRMLVCNSCPELIKLTGQCKKCGCVMSIKTMLQASKCPLDKW